VANLRSALRDIKKSRKRAERNKSVRSAIKTLVKRTRTTIQSGEAEAAAASLRETSSLLDKAAKRKIIHRNAANRRKSRLARQLQAMAAGAS
jgi:small subunit ribosomal protein S20